MPCYDDRDHDNSQIIERLNLATRVACDLSNTIRRLSKNWDTMLAGETVNWIQQHDAQDAKRIKQEGEIEKAKQFKAKALAKLTVEERKALGIQR